MLPLLNDAVVLVCLDDPVASQLTFEADPKNNGLHEHWQLTTAVITSTTNLSVTTVLNRSSGNAFAYVRLVGGTTRCIDT